MRKIRRSAILTLVITAVMIVWFRCHLPFNMEIQKGRIAREIIPDVEDAHQKKQPPEIDGKVTSRLKLEDSRSLPFSLRNISRKEGKQVTATRNKVLAEIQDFLHFTHKNASQLIPELGGTPVRCMLHTKWQTGSSFTGQGMAAHPGAFYHYEPLWKKVGIRILREGEKEVEEAIQNLRSQLFCEYREIERVRPQMHAPNKAAWFGSSFNRSNKDDSSFCKLYPVQIIKIHRFGSKIINTLLDDQSLNLRIILIEQDPRGTAAIRSQFKWCKDNVDCNDTKRLCDDMYTDYQVLLELKTLYPKRIMGIRIEDIASNPEDAFSQMYNFCGLQKSKQLLDYLESPRNPSRKGHDNKGKPYQNPSERSSKWKKVLSWIEIDSIQRTCTRAMAAWGYNKVTQDNMSYSSTVKQISFN